MKIFGKKIKKESFLKIIMVISTIILIFTSLAPMFLM